MTLGQPLSSLHVAQLRIGLISDLQNVEHVTSAAWFAGPVPGRAAGVSLGPVKVETGRFAYGVVEFSLVADGHWLIVADRCWPIVADGRASRRMPAPRSAAGLD